MNDDTFEQLLIQMYSSFVIVIYGDRGFLILGGENMDSDSSLRQVTNDEYMEKAFISGDIADEYIYVQYFMK